MAGNGRAQRATIVKRLNRGERFVAAKQFVAALPGKSDLESRLGSKLRNPVGIQAVHTGLIEGPDGMVEIGGYAAGVQHGDLMRNVQRARRSGG